MWQWKSCYKFSPKRRRRTVRIGECERIYQSFVSVCPPKPPQHHNTKKTLCFHQKKLCVIKKSTVFWTVNKKHTYVKLNGFFAQLLLLQVIWMFIGNVIKAMFSINFRRFIGKFQYFTSDFQQLINGLFSKLR